MNRIPSRRVRRQLRRVAPKPVRLYTCPRCHKKAAAIPLWSVGENVEMRCQNCGYSCSAYEAPMDEWPTLVWDGRREEVIFHG